MTESTDNKYTLYRRKVWLLYALITVVVMIFLATVVAQDNEERLFLSLMAAAAAYVFRPSERTIERYVLRLFGVSPPPKQDTDN
ncbi:MAG TPA: hypothetical protein ENJ64_03100 [Thiotrichales bacterium]|nr:hypothetical protein [Thiotrichales bacterium]